MALGNFRQNALPYCMEEQPDGGWVFLNREYQPIGFNNRDSYDHNRSILSLYFKRITDKQIDKLSISPDWRERWAKGNRKIWLYNDGSNPGYGKKNLDSYFSKISYLIKLECLSEGKKGKQKAKLIEHYITQKKK